MSTATASKADVKRQELLKKKAKVAKLMDTFVDLRAHECRLNDEWMKERIPYEEKLAEIKADYSLHLDPIKDKIEATRKQMLEIAGEKDKKGNLVNKELFQDGNWMFEDADGYYLHVKTETVPVFSLDFSLSKFIKKFSEYVNVKFKIAELKKIFTDGDQRAKFTALGFDLKNEESVEIKQKVERA